MNNIIFYETIDGKSDIIEYMHNLQKNPSKDNNLKLKKIASHIDNLRKYGINLGMPYLRHIEDEIWELRPLRFRIMFANVSDNNYILLNMFMKQTQKTPRKEIEKAKKLLEDYRRRKI